MGVNSSYDKLECNSNVTNLKPINDKLFGSVFFWIDKALKGEKIIVKEILLKDDNLC